MQLVIGNKNYSTWSLRPWLLLSAFDIPFEEIQVSLNSDGLSERLRQYSPSARVPVLIDDGIDVWDSLAICEYVSEQYLAGKGWPQDPIKRAQARTIVAEMHAGFSALRNELPMNIRAKRRVELSEQAQSDIQRVLSIWQHYRQQYQQDGDFLFGDFSIADSFYAPVVMRFATYGVELQGLATQYADTMRQLPALRSWIEGALTEDEIIAEDEAGEELTR